MDFHYLLALLSGGLVGLLLGATGGGGSLLAIPLLVYVVGIPVQKASAMSLIVVGYSALFGAWQESRHERVHVPAALVFSLTGVLGAWIGAQGHQLVSETVVLLLFGILLLLMSVWTFWQPHKEQEKEETTGCATSFSWPCALKASAIGWGVGLLTGFFGIGGGFLIVPALILLLGFPIRSAIGTSFLIIALIATGGVIGHLSLASLDIFLTGLVLVGSVLGLVFGSRVTRAMSSHHLRRSVAILIGAIGLGLILDNGWHFIF